MKSPVAIKTTGYAELVCQSHFSFLQGASSPAELVQQAAVLSYTALAITDECSLAGVVRAHHQIKEKQLPLKLIIGSLLVLNPQLRLVLLCTNKTAYSELCRIITQARRRAEKGSYQLAEWDIQRIQHCQILWLPSGDDQTDQYWGNWLQQHHAARLWLGASRKLQSQDQFYLPYCQQLAQQLQLPCCATGEVLMHQASRLPLQHALSAIKAGKAVPDMARQLLSNAEQSLRPIKKLQQLFPAELLDNSQKLADLCSFSLDELSYQYPAELVPEGLTAIQHLRALVKKGEQQRFPEGVPDDIQQTINKELDLIEQLNYPYYFLTIHDLVVFAQKQQILYQGRGSAANSVVCYCLAITAVDPRQIQVLIERFISIERAEPPDIDVDFEHERREEVIQYIYQKYGRERAALAATVICYRFKSAFRDISKALGFELHQVEFLLKNLHRRDKSQHWSSQLTQLGLDPQAKKAQLLVQLVQQLVGMPRHLSQHVGGFVISQGPLYELVPVENAAMADRTVIQWDKDDLESLKLLKVDVLALGMLSAIRKAFDLVRRYQHTDLSIAAITRAGDDPAVYKAIQKADTIGLFQIESRAQMSMLPRLRPQCYYDLVIQIAIVRPGPIQGDMVHPYLKRRHGEEAVSYPSPAVQNVLERTLGVPIFQEQVIKLAMVAAGFSGGEADQLRRAMASWKKTGELIQFKQKLIDGMLSRGYQQEFAERIYQQICGFGEYGFPESHSASFAVLAYVSAYLKHYYPVAFYVALLNSQPMGFYAPSQLIQDARMHDVEVLPVSVNQSDWDHLMVPASSSAKSAFAIRLGLRLVKGLSRQGAQLLLEHRPTAGYQQLAEVAQRGLSDSDLTALASANALQQLSGQRYQARWQLLDQQHKLPLLAAEPYQTQYQLPMPTELSEVVEDYQSTGLSLRTHPVQLLKQQGLLGKFAQTAELPALNHKSVVTVIGLVTARQSPGTASGVTFITLEDGTGFSNLVVWSATASAQRQPYLKSKLLKVNGILEKKEGVIHIIAGRLTDLTPLLGSLRSYSREFH
ncbi:error-prone DNA polymerase [Rheinheimera soli]|uniref:Error-prone DNA polymerase n=1 Tax=Rheinheimera soli TaxID=443616 RepID=A0ABU1W4H9_9GAMM|nr:error-prone DNA polymerase [Rheinheimera soli]MDR7122877.1 error-prone DNA polymerase [Rheinheimera soli]